ncbi:MAG: hypothetical protein KGL53_02785 [Elusimicrobia bacterium]|nr:hypothetical protein [Elusimicrobiota bacterium]
MSDCGLRRHFDALARKVPVGKDAGFLFTPRSFPRVPVRLSTDRLVVIKGLHEYHDRTWRVDRLQLYADKKTFRRLALLVLGVVLRAVPKVTLELSNPGSDVKRLILRSEWARHAREPRGFGARPDHFQYWPAEPLRHPWLVPAVGVAELPLFHLTNAAEAVFTEQDYQGRDTLSGFGADAAAVRLAGLLLDLSRPMNKMDEVELEGEGGFRGVAEQSSEAVLRLPGSFGWGMGWSLPKD